MGPAPLAGDDWQYGEIFVEERGTRNEERGARSEERGTRREERGGGVPLPCPATADGGCDDVPGDAAPHRLDTGQVRKNQGLGIDDAGGHPPRAVEDGGQHLAYLIYYTARCTEGGTGGQGRRTDDARRATDDSRGAKPEEAYQRHRTRRVGNGQDGVHRTRGGGGGQQPHTPAGGRGASRDYPHTDGVQRRGAPPRGGDPELVPVPGDDRPDLREGEAGRGDKGH